MDEECRLLYSASIYWLYVGMHCDAGGSTNRILISEIRNQLRDKVCHVDEDNNINIVTMAMVLIWIWTCILM